MAYAKPGDGKWLTQTGINSVLRFELPEKTEIVSDGEIWKEELRTGLERNTESRTAKEGMLYSTQHVRLNGNVSLGARIAGLPEEWDMPFGQMALLGGERRMAECREWEVSVSFEPPLQDIKSSRRLTLIALSSLDIEKEIYLGKCPIENLGNARVVSACMDRLQRIGGWDSLTSRPLPIRSVLPPGSVLFCEVNKPECLKISDNGLARIGRRQQWGFGLVALGTWPDKQEVR